MCIQADNSARFFRKTKEREIDECKSNKGLTIQLQDDNRIR